MIELLWNAPVSEARMTHYLNALEATSGAVALDAGCGCGEALIRSHELCGLSGLGFDISSDHVEEARRRAIVRKVSDAIRFTVADGKTFDLGEAAYDVVLCLGASHALVDSPAAYASAVGRLATVVKPGGKLLIGEGYMKQPAPRGYRELLGDSMPDEMTHAANVAVGVDSGLTPLGAWTSSSAEWDDFEWAYQREVERAAASRPEVSEANDRLARRRGWIDAYLKWGRDTLGYGTYLFQQPKT